MAWYASKAILIIRLPLRLRSILLGIMLLLGFTKTLNAQDEGRSWDLGVLVGSSHYMGDASRGLGNVAPAVGFNLRYNHNLRFSGYSSLLYHSQKGESSSSNNFPNESRFSSHSTTLSCGMEYNWYQYGEEIPYLKVEHFSPYLALGGNLTLAWEDKVLLSPGLYASLGIKYRLSPHLDLSLSCSWHYLFSDRLDALNSSSRLSKPFGQNANVLRHGDSFALLTLGVGWRIKGRRINCY